MQQAAALNQRAPAAEGRPSRATLDIARLLHPLDWARLPQSLRQRLEAGHGPARYTGAMAFQRTAIGAAFAWLSQAFGAPLPMMTADDAPVTVNVCPTGDGVMWSRQLGPGRFVRSIKSLGPAGTLLERTEGGLGMILEVSVEDGALVFTSRSFFFAAGRWRVPIPSILTPGRCRVEHRAVDDTHFRFTLTMVHPFWGTTFRQTGVFTDSLEVLA